MAVLTRQPGWPTHKLLNRPDAVGAQYVGQCDDAEDFKDIRTAHDREYIEVHFTHSLQGQVERMIGVDMREIAGIQMASRQRFKNLGNRSVTRTVVCGVYPAQTSKST